ncbi:Asp-tRNA(Asn)/Glu-tRNA(Gln) amidotransferase subunit GatB [Alicyclobacillus tolerans]|uniref:Aspartyl/glutamyl-tRNA(Asn/Gln) amidotransferase subunit B n=2 Tax=Alicyclobacillus tolerans TaxID=90970 RepID=A0ABT9LZG3_9BACL|nr:MULTISPECIES: Asp-tRNA(Asn)/Glu-tRNA(Gln) amidotransferase subunit GatB [Alicyclobacillus]MDP9729668.1 aspartyl-tRNA(Asn)/glutamyl-tRNA(Gln) amidotransferase subunit B [Alicyclobacillus tengchongensis]QRF22726.1 Asp-tRNA(Asn)/Glu-tRNA(Gln) amidotransferase subunit GatB [Alicyclobacillus sp. TC]SHK00363.1 aspartyl/glutamyl-tRNA(Asn/Gln) amidotransferase subunit B [Alicyclobacillus montanus]
MNYETVIGLEVHVELKTATKIFCGCKNESGSEPNTHVCPVCLGHPGTLPVLNEQAVNLALRAALALNCQINQESKFDRKNYFYPDLPKGYQISQYDKPVGEHGYLEIEIEGKTKRIGITRLHLEEDAGKSMHAADGSHTLVDYNRTGVPLIEIVSEPDIRSPEEARLYLEALKSIMQYCDVSDCRMEEGSLRCDANISLRPLGSEKFGNKAELKNMNSFRNVQRGLEYEEKRQRELLESGQTVVQETRRFDEATQTTVSMRSKEEAHDYRYFPEPDLALLHMDDAWLERVRREIPELPHVKARRYVESFGLPAYDAGVLTAERAVAEYFEAVVAAGAQAKTASNWVMGDLLGALNAAGKSIADSKVTANQLAQLIEQIESGKISIKQGREVFREMFETGVDAAVIIQQRGYEQISDESALSGILDEIISKNPKSVEDYLNGKEKALGALVGQTMKATKGQANPGVVNKLLLEKISALKAGNN